MAVEHVWDTTAADSTSEELAYFAALGFAVPTAAGCICALSLKHMLDWLLKPRGPPLVEGEEVNIHGNVPYRAFALLIVLQFLYCPGGMPLPNPMVGLGVVFIPPYVKKISFTDAYFFLNQWVRVGSAPLKKEQVMFLHSSSESTAIPYLQPYPMWLDYVTKDLIKEAPKHAPLHCFWAFCLHRIVVVVPDRLSGRLAPYMYTPHCEGHDPFLEPDVPKSVPRDLANWVHWDIRMAKPTEFHWALEEDKAFHAHLAQVKQDWANREAPASKGKDTKHKNAASKGGSAAKVKKPRLATKGKTSTLQLLLNEARLEEGGEGDPDLSGLAGGLLDTPLSDSVKDDVDELLGSICSFQLQAMYEMGSVRMVDRALAEGFSAEFLRLSRVVTEDLTKSLCHHHK